MRVKERREEQRQERRKRTGQWYAFLMASERRRHDKDLPHCVLCGLALKLHMVTEVTDTGCSTIEVCEGCDPDFVEAAPVAAA